MSAYLIVERQDRLHLFTDGMAIKPDGVASWIRRKIHHLDNGSGVIFGRGSYEIFTAVADHANGAGWGFDATVEAIPHIAPTCRDQVVRQFGPCWQWEIGLAGWSDARQRLEAYLWPDHDLHDDTGLPAHTLSSMLPWYAAPPSDETHIEALGWARQGLEVGFWRQVGGHLLGNSFEPRRDGLAFMEGQRLTPAIEGEQAAVGSFGVGGFCLWTEITATGCADKVLRIWPDKIGEKIEPAA